MQALGLCARRWRAAELLPMTTMTGDRFIPSFLRKPKSRGERGVPASPPLSPPLPDSSFRVAGQGGQWPRRINELTRVHRKAKLPSLGRPVSGASKNLTNEIRRIT